LPLAESINRTLVKKVPDWAKQNARAIQSNYYIWKIIQDHYFCSPENVTLHTHI
jgi:hypothetical protein